MSKENLEEFAYRSIIQMIFENKYKPGNYLLETELARELNISRTPIRYAINKLVAEGFLDKKKKKGCIIPVPTLEDARQVFEAREIVEGKTAESAAIHATKSDIDKLKSINQKHHKTYGSQNKLEYTLINERFHLEIARMAKNKYLERYCKYILWRSNIYIFFFDIFYLYHPGLDLTHLSPREHTEIVNAIKTKNHKKAGNIMRRHIRETYNLLFLPREKEKDSK